MQSPNPAEDDGPERKMVYQAALQLIQIRGLDNFIEYLQEAAESGVVPRSCGLDHDAYLAVLRQAVNDYRRRVLDQ